jgi:putative Mn2+ efflux pump MntP
VLVRDALGTAADLAGPVAGCLFRKFLKIALAFGLFQAVMPLLGSVLSKFFLARYIAQYAYLISFLVFAALALKTFYDFFTSGTEETKATCACSGYRCLVSLSIATSIDAFLIGAVLGLQEVASSGTKSSVS